MSQNQLALPPSFNLPYSPVDDPSLTLTGRLYPPDPNVWGTGPFPGIVFVHAGGYVQGGPQPPNYMAHDLCGDALGGLEGIGFVGLFADIRLAKDTNGHGGLRGQTTTGHWDQQTLDCAAAINYLRSQSICNGDFVAIASGSASGGHAAQMAAQGLANAAICLSAQFDAGDRDQVTSNFIAWVVQYFDSTDLPTLTTRSPISYVDGTCKPIYLANGTREPMPFTVFNRMLAKLQGCGLTNFVSHVNTQGNSAMHSFATYPENADGIKTFLTGLIS